MNRETRCFELRAANGDNKQRRLVGYASVFNSDSENLGGVIETIKPGAFTEALKTSDCRALLNHDTNVVLGRQSAGTLKLSEDQIGLKCEILLPDTIAASDLYQSVKRGDVREMSFAFTVDKDEWSDLDKRYPRRTIHRVAELFDVSPVTFPAYTGTVVEARKKSDNTVDSDSYTNPLKRHSNEATRGFQGAGGSRPMAADRSAPYIGEIIDENNHMKDISMNNGYLQEDKKAYRAMTGREPDVNSESFRGFQAFRHAAVNDVPRHDPRDTPDPNRAVELLRAEEDRGFNTLGEQLRAIRAACSPGGFRDPRLDAVMRASGLNEAIGSDGGFLVQTEHANEIMQNVWDQPILKLIRRITLSSGANGLTVNGFDETSRADGSRSGGIQAFWKSEAEDSHTPTKPKFRQIDLRLCKLFGLCYASDELLEDVTALGNIIGAAFQDELNFRIADAVINGTGSGQPLGILNSGCLVACGEASPGGTLQAANTLVYENVCAMWSRLLPGSHANAVWLVNPNVLPALYTMSLLVGSTGGGPVYLPARGASASPYDTLFGRPVIPVEQCQTLGTKGDIILADLSKYICIDKGAPKQDVSMHVRFVYGESTFRVTYRFDGQPMLASAITPKNGTATLSHFVALTNRDGA